MNTDVYIILAYTVLIFIFMFCGVLRMCNLFPHAIKNMSDFYPARKLVVGIYFSVMLLLPCVFYPQSSDALLLARCFWILYIPASASLAFRLFFQRGKGLGAMEYLCVGGIPLAVMLVMSVFALLGGEALCRHEDIVTGIVDFLFIVLTVCLIRVTLWIWKMIHGKADVSSVPTPRRFALGIFWLPLVALFVARFVYHMDSAVASATFAVATALVGSGILVVILRPQRIEIDNAGFAESCDDEQDKEYGETQDYEDILEDDEAEEMEGAAKLSVEAIDKIEQQIHDAVERGQLFLKPDLTKTMLVSQLGINDLYLHIVLKKRFGPFNKYINTLRMEYAIRYENEHPEVKREELALLSGFGSVRTYYRVKTQYEAECSDN